MRSLLSIIFISLCFALSAQTPFTSMSLQKKSSVSGSRVASANNAWIGAGLLYNVTGDVSGSFILNAQGFYMAASGANYGIPILTNVALNQNDTLNDESGVRFGVYPYYILTSEGRFKLVAHAGLAYNILDKQNADTRTQFRALLGLEAAFYPNDNRSPFTLSIAPEYISSVQDVSENKWQLSVTGVMPVAPGLGLLVESQTPFSNDLNGSIQLGVIVTSELGK